MKGWLFYIVGTGMIAYGLAKWNTSKHGNEDFGVSIAVGIGFIIAGVAYSIF